MGRGKGPKRRKATSPKAKLETELAGARRALKRERAARRQLEKRLAESLDQQTATSEILRVISRSPGDLQPVLNAMAENAARLCDARDAIIMRADGDVLRVAASVGPFAEAMVAELGPDYGYPITRQGVAGRAFVDRTTLHIHDLAAESDDEYPTGKQLQRCFGHRTMLATPLLRDETALGVIGVFRTEVRPFSDSQVELLKTFADQAVIAIDNARLFKELEARNAALTEALEQQTATSEILSVISSSPTDVQPVFETIARNAARLCGAVRSLVTRYDGALVHLGATQAEGSPEERHERFPWHQLSPRPAARAGMIGQVIVEATIVHVPDIEHDARVSPTNLEFARRGGYRSFVVVPMLRDGRAVGAIAVGHPEPRPFTDKQIDSLKTFADQAVIAIENGDVRARRGDGRAARVPRGDGHAHPRARRHAGALHGRRHDDLLQRSSAR